MYSSDRVSADLGRHSAALVARVGAAHDLGSPARRARDFHRSGVLRHHDRRRHAEERGGRSDTLGMVAAGIRHDAALDHVERRRREGVEGAAELERAGALEALGLDVDLALERQPQERCADGDPVEPARRRFDVGERHGN